MAKSAARRKRTVNVDFEGVEVGAGGGVHIPAGEYGVKVKSADLGTSSNDNEQIEWQFIGTEGKAKGKTFYFYTPLVEQALWKLRETLESLGVEVPDSAMDIDLDELIDLEATGVIEDDEYQGKTRSKLVKVIGEGGASEEEEEKPAKGKKKPAKVVKVSEEEVKDMSEDELESLIEKYSLDVDLSEFKILRKKVAAVIADLQEKELLED